MELLFNVDRAGLLEAQQTAPHPGHLLPAHALLGNIDGRPGQMRAGDIALGSRGVAVALHQPLLVRDRPHGRADFKRPMEGSLMNMRQIGEEIAPSMGGNSGSFQTDFRLQ